MPAELEFKLVMSTKDGKSYQKELKGQEAENIMRKRIGEAIKGDDIGFEGYEFEITGGSDKAGFPMRKGIQEKRKRIMTSGGVGFSGTKRFLNKKKHLRKQKGLNKRRTVCGERIATTTAQINLKVLTAGKQPLGEAPAEAAPAAE
jgi:small subunit ribosomal protein S6e